MKNQSQQVHAYPHLLITCAIIFLISSGGAAQHWVEDSYEDFSDGYLDAAGQNIYVCHDGTVRTIHRFDLNQDGHLDLIFNNTHDTSTDHEATLASFDSSRVVTQKSLAVQGSTRAAAGDLNNDGFADLVFCPNQSGIQDPRRFLTIIWGGADGWPPHRSHGLLPVRDCKDVTIADINQDGWADVIALTYPDQWQRGNDDGATVARIHWGSPAGFSVLRREDVDVPQAIQMASGDFDGDKTNDLAVLTSEAKVLLLWAQQLPGDSSYQATLTTLELPESNGQCIVASDITSDGRCDLLVGTSGSHGYLLSTTGGRDFGKPVELPVGSASHATAHDLDADGHTDLVLTNLIAGKALGGEQGAAIGSEPVRILWGGPDGFATSRSTPLQIQHASAVAGNDFDGDGIADLAVAVYQNENTFSAKSLVYFGAGNRTFAPNPFQIDSTGAKHVITAQCDRDHPPAVIICNSLGGTIDEKIPLQIFWGGAAGFDPSRQWRIPFVAGYETSAADLNADGYVDLIALNSGHGGQQNNPTLGANLFWGSGSGFDPDKHRTVLRERNLGTSNVADLDRDGYLDLVLGAFEHEGDPEILTIRYGSANGFSQDRRVTLPSERRSIGTLIADFDDDRWLDIAVSCFVTNRIRIFYGAQEGFDPERLKILELDGGLDMETADLNADGKLDLIVGSYHDPVTHHHDMGITIYWGSDDGFAHWNAQWLPGMTPLGLTVADFDSDGYLDLFSPHYHGNGVREEMACYLYWGGEDGLKTSRKTNLICDSPSDAMAGDFNSDGLLDLAVSCHTQHGSHQTNSKVFYNDAARFTNPETVILPTLGTHWMYFQDVGHIAHRKWVQTYESSVFQWDRSNQQGCLRFDAETPGKSSVSFAIRSAATEELLYAGNWRELESESFVVQVSDRCLQYRATFESDNGDRYPVLDRVEITFDER